MQTTLRLNDQLYRAAKARAAQEGITLTRFIEEALNLRLRAGQQGVPNGLDAEELRRQEAMTQRNILMDGLLDRTAHYRIGPKPTRDEMHER
jgi:hypothetical protein